MTAPSSTDRSKTSHLPLDPQTTETLSPEFGWTQYAEKINGRFAMVGFVALLTLELLTRQDFFTWIGLP
ncbi:MAG: hypothetical protein HC800_15395 [Phormidesmis sp. RL_2_1]|nr:hypothetical protein [Phormidesmis sp. RL_2_1]